MESRRRDPGSEDRIARRHPVSGPQPDGVGRYFGPDTISRRGGWLSMVDSARSDEAPLLADCWRAMLDELKMSQAGFQPDWRGSLARFFAEGIDQGRQGWFVVRDSAGLPVACAGALIPETAMIQVERIATIGGVYVRPEYRRRGLARELTEAAIAWAREHGCTLVRLSASEPAESLYRSIGFTKGREMILRLV
jgi:GNAT superfamily N-acetyltransferase